MLSSQLELELSNIKVEGASEEKDRIVQINNLIKQKADEINALSNEKEELVIKLVVV